MNELDVLRTVSNGTVPRYRERLWPAPWLYLACSLVIPASLLVFLPINFLVGVGTAVVLYCGSVGLLFLASPVIEVADGRLRAGRATLPLEAIADTETARGERARLERGQRLDARAWLLIRGWIDPVIKVELADPGDPTPYWLLSTRNPERLEAVLKGTPRGDA
jgi:hypothetical protein